MKIRLAELSDIALIQKHDEHIEKDELTLIISLGRVLIAEKEGCFIGWLRWSLFWDNTPFINMLYILSVHRSKGYGNELVDYWEKLMKKNGFNLVMTSTLSSEQAQHFYRKVNYVDSGSILLKNQPLEIIFTKEI